MRLSQLGSVSQNRLGDAVGMPRANIHKMVERLAARGLVTTHADPADARRRVIDLTRAGRALVKELILLDEASTADALAPFNARERATLCALLRRLL